MRKGTGTKHEKKQTRRDHQILRPRPPVVIIITCAALKFAFGTRFKDSWHNHIIIYLCICNISRTCCYTRLCVGRRGSECELLCTIAPNYIRGAGHCCAQKAQEDVQFQWPKMKEGCLFFSLFLVPQCSSTQQLICLRFPRWPSPVATLGCSWLSSRKTHSLCEH